MHTLAALIVEEPHHADEILERFKERWDDEITWGYWDWWSHGGRWAVALAEEGHADDEAGYFVLSLEDARAWGPPIVVTPYGHVFDSAQMDYEVARGAHWDAVRCGIFDEFAKRRDKYGDKYVVVMVDVHS